MHKLRVGVFALIVLVATAPAALALVSYFATIDSQQTGRIPGGVTQKGREGTIEVLSIDHEIVSPRDPATGQATGKRQHKPMSLHVKLDKSAPRLFQAMVTNDTLSKVSLRGYVPSQNGVEVQHFMVELTNAQISRIAMSSVTHASGAPEKDTIELELVYQKITWTWTDGGITAEDDWESRAQ